MPATGSQRRVGGGRPAVAGLAVLLFGVLALLLTACTPPGLPDPIAPSGVTSVPTSPPAAGTVVIGLDGTAGRIAGFNPYSIADFSPASQAAASLVLPSAFVVAADGTVVARSRRDRQGGGHHAGPVHRHLHAGPEGVLVRRHADHRRGLLLPAGPVAGPARHGRPGRLPTDQRRSGRGTPARLVEVEFSEPFPDWPTLFSPLLPSHLMKDFPGGWGAALGADLPLSANRYKMTSYDPVTGQITLARNDKYWGTPPQPAAVVLRLGDPADLLAAFSRGDVQALWFSPDGCDGDIAAGRGARRPADGRAGADLGAAGLQHHVRAHREPVRSGPPSPPGSTQSVVAADLTGGWSDGGTTVTSQVRLPSHRRTGGGRRDARSPVVTGEQAASSALAGAGYVRNGLYVSRDGEVLRLTLGLSQRRSATGGRGQDHPTATRRHRHRDRPAAGRRAEPGRDPNRRRRHRSRPAGASRGGCGRGVGCVGLRLPDRQRARYRLHRDDRRDADRAHRRRRRTRRPRGWDSRFRAATSTAATADHSRRRRRLHSGPAHRQPVRLLPGRRPNEFCSTRSSGGRPSSAADPALWADLPVLPLIQPSAVFAVAEPLRTVLAGPHEGWMWSGPLSGLSGWPVS